MSELVLTIGSPESDGWSCTVRLGDLSGDVFVPERLFTAEDRVDVRWYTETYLRLPEGGFAVRARTIEARLLDVGAALGSLLVGTEAGQAWFDAGGGTLRLTASRGTPDVQTWPWELASRPRGVPLHQRGVEIVRDLDDDLEPGHVAPPPLRVLLVPSRPEESPWLDATHTPHAILRAIARLERKIELVICRPPTLGGLSRALARADAEARPYSVVHFDGHGTLGPDGQVTLLFEGDDGRAEPVPMPRLAAALRPAPRLAILEACQSAMVEPGKTASLHVLGVHGVGAVVAFSHSIRAGTTARLLACLYESLALGHPVDAALSQARARLRADPAGIDDWFVPQLWRGTGQVQFRPVDARPADVPDVPDTFLAPSRALHAFERELRRASPLLVWGPIGVGKSALVAEGARWGAATGAFPGGVRRVDAASGADEIVAPGTSGTRLLWIDQASARLAPRVRALVAAAGPDERVVITAREPEIGVPVEARWSVSWTESTARWDGWSADRRALLVARVREVLDTVPAPAAALLPTLTLVRGDGDRRVVQETTSLQPDVLDSLLRDLQARGLLELDGVAVTPHPALADCVPAPPEDVARRFVAEMMELTAALLRLASSPDSAAAHRALSALEPGILATIDTAVRIGSWPEAIQLAWRLGSLLARSGRTADARRLAARTSDVPTEALPVREALLASRLAAIADPEHARKILRERYLRLYVTRDVETRAEQVVVLLAMADAAASTSERGQHVHEAHDLHRELAREGAVDLHREMQIELALAATYRQDHREGWALEHARTAAALCARVGTTEDRALCAWELGSLHLNLGEAKLAIRYLEEAIRLFGEAGDGEQESLGWQTLGIAYQRLDRLDLAEVALRRAVASAKVARDPLALARAYTSLGDTDAARDRTAEADAWYRQAITVADAADGAEEADQARARRALLLANELVPGEPRASAELTEQVNQLGRELGDRPPADVTFTTRVARGRALLAEGRHVEALEQADAACRLVLEWEGQEERCHPNTATALQLRAQVIGAAGAPAAVVRERKEDAAVAKLWFERNDAVSLPEEFAGWFLGAGRDARREGLSLEEGARRLATHLGIAEGPDWLVKRVRGNWPWLYAHADAIARGASQWPERYVPAPFRKLVLRAWVEAGLADRPRWPPVNSG